MTYSISQAADLSGSCGGYHGGRGYLYRIFPGRTRGRIAGGAVIEDERKGFLYCCDQRRSGSFDSLSQ